MTVEFNENDNGNFYANDLSKAGKKLFIGKNVKDVVTADVLTLFDDDNKLANFLKLTPEMIQKDQPDMRAMTIKYIGHLEPAEINDDFFKKAFPKGEVKNMEELRKEGAAKVEAEYATSIRQKFMNDAITTLVDNLKIQLPEEFLRRYILAAQEDITEEKLNAEFDKYMGSFKWQLIENKLTKENDIKVTEEDVRNYVRNFFLKNYFAQFNAEDVAERVDAMVADTLKNKDTVKSIYDQLFDEAIGNVLQDKMKSKVKKLTFKEFADELYGIKDDKKEEKKPKAKKTTAKKAEAAPAAEATEEAKPKAKKAPAKTKKATPKAE